MRTRAVSAMLVGLFCLTGCLERLEVVRIGADGVVSVEHRIKGDGGDLRGGAAALPGEKTHTVQRFTRPKKDGKGKEHFLVARATYDSVARMPESYASPESKFAARQLRWSNRLLTVREGKRTRYVFIRSYVPRRWADYQYQRRRAFPDEVEKLAREDWGKKPWAERRKVIGSMVTYERYKNVEWVSQALAGMPLDSARRALALTAAGDALKAHFAAHLTPARVAGLMKLDEDRMAAEAGRLVAEVERVAIDAAARAAGLDARGRTTLTGGFAAARHDFEVTEDLGDESFEVRVSLPGKLVRHNGDSASGSTVTWKFDGKDLRDRSQRLIAISELVR